MIGWILSDPEIMAWLNKPGREKLYNSPKYVSVDIVLGLIATFDYFAPPIGNPAGDAMTNIDAGGLLAPDPEQFLVTSLQHAVDSTDDTVSVGVLADAITFADSQRLIKQGYVLHLQSSQGTEIFMDRCSHIPAGPAQQGFLSTGGFSLWGTPDMGDAMPFVYEVSTNGKIRARMDAVGVTPAGVLPTTTATMRSTLYFNGVRFKTKVK